MKLRFTSEDPLGSIARGIARLQELELADDIDEAKAVMDRLNLPAMRDADLWLWSIIGDLERGSEKP